MDANKLKELLSVDYHISSCCGLCIYADLRGTKDWGECNAHSYDHLKHTQSRRRMSINRIGVCRFFKPNPDAIVLLGKWQDLIDIHNWRK